MITPLPGTSVHMIAAGGAMGEAAAAVDRDRINMLLDALDEVYDHIVISAAGMTCAISSRPSRAASMPVSSSRAQAARPPAETSSATK